MSLVHHTFSLAEWQKLSLVEQLGNIGSEISRLNKARARGKEQRARAAFERALELFDVTLADPRHRLRRKELCRAREVVCDFYAGDNMYGSSAESLDRYFLQYALAARRHA